MTWLWTLALVGGGGVVGWWVWSHLRPDPPDRVTADWLRAHRYPRNGDQS